MKCKTGKARANSDKPEPGMQVMSAVRSTIVIMKVIHLSDPSLSGELEERLFDATGDCEWFKFVPERAEEWVGIFGWGDRGECFAIVSSNNSFTFVVSRGKAYAIDNTSRDVLFKVKDIFIQGGIPVPGKAQILVFDTDSLYIFNRNGKVWDYYFHGIDRIRNLRIEKDKVLGEAYHYDNSNWISWSVALMTD